MGISYAQDRNGQKHLRSKSSNPYLVVNQLLHLLCARLTICLIVDCWNVSLDDYMLAKASLVAFATFQVQYQGSPFDLQIISVWVQLHLGLFAV
jgi:hypothetical protein